MVGLVVRVCGRTAGGNLSNQRLANLRPTSAAVLHKEAGKVANGSKARTVDNGPAMTLGFDQAGACKHGEMRRHCVVRNGEPPRHVASRQAMWLMLNQQTKDVQSCGLRERREGENGLLCFHMSRLIDMLI